ncbi:transcriptional regulator PdhR [Klebsiella pneumoniae]|uniref:Transcriptional regulator PdhR n=1 Tax=Klebsiella pneumoniae TaxID=573 RepID=A0A377W9J2_KLEPN|nr:transcriptional regulator PdhR [Klebsiella pneumoniae]
MAYSKIRQPKLSDVIEQQLEFLILEGTLRPGEKLPPERELAKQFDVSRPSLREAIQRLEAKGLLLRRQGGGTFVQSRLWQSFSDPLVELLSDHPESQFDLLETRHALEGIAAYYAALRSNDEDRDRIVSCIRLLNALSSRAIWTLSPAPSSSIKSPSPRRHTMWCCFIC